jgi:hypothetical protein
MAVDVERLLVSIEANLKQYEKEMARANQITVREMRRAAKTAEVEATRIERALGGIGSGLKSFGAGIIGGLSVEAIARAAQQAIKSIADIGDAAKRLGLSNSDYQELALAAHLTGVETEALASGMKILAKNSSDAAHGNGELGKILKLNKVSIKDANGELLSQTEILKKVADLVQNAASEQDKAAVASAAFGKAGADMIQLMDNGAAGIVNAMQTARDAGVKFTDEQIAKASEFDDKIDLLIEKISVELKGSFIDAAIGAESLAERAAAALDKIGLKSEAAGNAFIAALKYNPAVLSSTLALDYLKSQGAAVSKPIAQDPSIAGRAQSAPLASAGGKGDRQTILPDAEAEKKAEEARRKATEAAKEAARAAAQRAKAISDVIDALKFETDQLGRNELQQQINAKLRDAGVSATSKQGKEIAALVTKNYELSAAQDVAKESLKGQIDAAQEASDKFAEQYQAMQDSVMQLGQMGFDALMGVVDGSMKAKDAVKNLAKELAYAAAQAALFGQGPLAGLFGTSSGGGFLGGLLGGGTPVPLYHSGGVVGAGGQSRTVHPGVFSGAPRMHSGGVAGIKPGEVPAILQRGEVVIPRGVKQASNQKPVIIIDQRKNAPQVERQTSSDGSLRILIKDQVNSMLGTGELDTGMGRYVGGRSNRRRS